MQEKVKNHQRITELCVKYFKKGKVLDLGSGDGILIKKISEKTRIKPKNITGVELNKKYVKKIKKAGFNIKSFDINEKFPFKDKEFDYIISNQIIEHLYFTDEFMEEIHRVLKPGGILILSSTNLAALHSRIILLLGFMPNALHPSINPVGTLIKKKGNNPLYGHKSVFTGKALKEFTTLHKFKILLYETQSIMLVPSFFSKIICKFFDFGGHVNIVAKRLIK